MNHTKFPVRRLVLTVALFILVTNLNCSQPAYTKQNFQVTAGSALTDHPMVEFLYIPDYESFDKLTGQVSGVKTADYKIVVYIKVGPEWRIKPGTDQPFTPIAADGKWSCNITGAPNDQRASQIRAFLIPDSYVPDMAVLPDSLPGDLYANAVASMEVVRTPDETYRMVTFAGYQWRVKECTTMCGPGPNYFSAGANNVWLDMQGFLHLRITRDDSLWNCAEVILQQNLGYGHYEFHIRRIEHFDEYGVLGLFTWDDAPDDNHREIDVEISKWSQPSNDNAQYVIQPYDENDNMHRFNLDLNLDIIHTFEWGSDAVYFESKAGDGVILQSWSYEGLDIPAPGNENPRINLWLCDPDSADTELETVIKDFKFYRL